MCSLFLNYLRNDTERNLSHYLIEGHFPPPPPMVRQPLGGLGRLIFEATRSHFLDTPQSVGLLWTRDQLVAETYLTTHNTHKRHPCPRRDSNPQS
jgi:hypothetical protein